MSQIQFANAAATQVPSGDVTRLDRWLGLETGSPRFINLTPDMLKKMTPEQIMEVTMSNLMILGAKENNDVLKKLPNGHKMLTPKSFKPQIVRQAPWMGACKIGEVIVDKKDDKFLLHQVFMTNFETDLNTSGKGELYVPKGNQLNNTPKSFFGVHLIVDRLGKPLAFERSRGKEGVSFNTSNRDEAMFEIAAASVNLTAQELAERLKARRSA